MRGSQHAKHLVQFEIGKQGPVILGKLDGLTGVLGWTAFTLSLQRSDPTAATDQATRRR